MLDDSLLPLFLRNLSDSVDSNFLFLESVDDNEDALPQHSSLLTSVVADPNDIETLCIEHSHSATSPPECVVPVEGMEDLEGSSCESPASALEAGGSPFRVLRPAVLWATDVVRMLGIMQSCKPETGSKFQIHRVFSIIQYESEYEYTGTVYTVALLATVTVYTMPVV